MQARKHARTRTHARMHPHTHTWIPKGSIVAIAAAGSAQVFGASAVSAASAANLVVARGEGRTAGTVSCALNARANGTSACRGSGGECP